MKAKLFVLSALWVLAGCSQNPFPTSGRMFLKQPQKTEPAPVADIEMPAFLECEEGKACSAPIHGVFGDEGGTPILAFATTSDGATSSRSGLPDGAAYDADQETLNFTPDFGTVDTAKDPTRTYKVLNIEATLRKLEDPVTVYKRRNLLVTVRNTPRAVDLLFPDAPKTANEGDALHATLTVNSIDYPQGPFQLVIKNAPAGVSATATSPNQFTVNYAIPYDTVSLEDPIDPATGRNSKTYSLEYMIVLPSGETHTVASALEISDTRLAPVVSYPTEITQGPAVEFTIRVDDLNGERAPMVRLPASMPVGKLTLTEIPLTTPGIRAHLFNIRWDGIPATESGKKFEFPFLVCGATSPTENTQCKNYVTLITIAKGGRKP